MNCYTVHKSDYVPPKLPWGGNFGIECFTLKYLYEELQFHQNIWTASNLYKDLCRYLYCRLTLFRHPETDFIIAYKRQGPFDLTKFTFPGCHPQQLLLEKHKKILLSQASKPNGKYAIKLKIKPPKQMISKWFFTKDFSTKTLFQLKAAACNFRYSFLSGKNENMLVTIYSINPKYFITPDWGHSTGPNQPYKPYSTMHLPQKYKVQVKGSTELQTKTMTITDSSSYGDSVNYNTGWFKSEFLQAKELVQDSGKPIATHQAFSARYNPNKDTGEGNEIYCLSITADRWDPPSKDKTVYLVGMPLWLGLYGFYSYVIKTKGISFLGLHTVIIKSPAIHCYPEIGACDRYCPIDWEIFTGKLPYDQTITTFDKTQWFPTMHWQKKTINAIVESGPLMPKYNEETYSTWELKLGYSFYFKWGGPHTDEPEITNPEQLQTYDVPDTIQQNIQITNPEKTSPETILHSWDFRRGFVTERALKRMYDNFETDSEFQCSPAKIKKERERIGAAPPCKTPQEEEIQTCLQALSEENIYQETPQQDLHLLIQQQQQQQQELKRNILMLLMDLKTKQRMLQLQTGMLS